MTMPRNPVEFVRHLASGLYQRAGNRVQLEDEDAQAINETNPLPVTGPLTNAQLRAAAVTAREESIVAAAADVNAPAVNTAAVVTYGASAGNYHVITGVAWSYIGGVPVGGNLLITDAGATVFSIDIAEEGPGFFTFPAPKRGAAVNTAMVVTLAAGGAGITGKVSVLNHWLEAA